LPLKLDQALDAAGLACPLPIVKTGKALRATRSGQVFRVVGPGPGKGDGMPSPVDEGSSCPPASASEGARLVFLIRKDRT
jgi:tRNA 2-thiouridine synthesizing protein A